MKCRLTRWFRYPGSTADLVIFNKNLKKHTRIKLPRSGSTVVDLSDLMKMRHWVGDKQTFVRIESVSEPTDSTSDSVELIRRIRMSELTSQVKKQHITEHAASDSIWADADRAIDLLSIWTYILPEHVENNLIRLHTEVVGGFGRGQRLSNRSSIIRVAQRYIEKGHIVAGSLVSEVLTDLYLWYIIESARVSTAANENDDRSVEAWRTVVDFAREHPSLACSHLWLAFDASRRGDRYEASRQFESARTLDSSSFLQRAVSLRGLLTYIDKLPLHGDVQAVQLDPTIKSISGTPESTEWRRAVVFSGDIKFFRRYFPRIHYYARLMESTQLHLHLIGDEAHVREAVEDGLHLAAGTDHLMSDDRKASISITFENMPRGVGEIKTYYACARFIRAPEFLELYPEGVWIQDLDLVHTGPVEPMFNKLMDSDFGAAESPVAYGSVPWKSLLAGSVWAANTEATRRLLSDASSYIRAFLYLPSTWMLDQNALRYAVDLSNTELKFVNMHKIGAPVGQNSLSRIIEQD